MKRKLLQILEIGCLLPSLLISCGNKNNTEIERESAASDSKVSESISIEDEEKESLTRHYIIHSDTILINSDDSLITLNNVELDVSLNENKRLEGILNANAQMEYYTGVKGTGYLRGILDDHFVYGSLYQSCQEDRTKADETLLILDLNNALSSTLSLEEGPYIEIIKSYEKLINWFETDMLPIINNFKNGAKIVLDNNLQSSLELFVKDDNSNIYRLNEQAIREIPSDLESLTAKEFLTKYLGEKVYGALVAFAPIALDLNVGKLLDTLKTHFNFDVLDVLKALDNLSKIISGDETSTFNLFIKEIAGIELPNIEQLIASDDFRNIKVSDLIIDQMVKEGSLELDGKNDEQIKAEFIKSIKEQIATYIVKFEFNSILSIASGKDAPIVKKKIQDAVDMVCEAIELSYDSTKTGAFKEATLDFAIEQSGINGAIMLSDSSLYSYYAKDEYQQLLDLSQQMYAKFSVLTKDYVKYAHNQYAYIIDEQDNVSSLKYVYEWSTNYITDEGKNCIKRKEESDFKLDKIISILIEDGCNGKVVNVNYLADFSNIYYYDDGTESKETHLSSDSFRFFYDIENNKVIEDGIHEFEQVGECIEATDCNGFDQYVYHCALCNQEYVKYESAYHSNTYVDATIAIGEYTYDLSIYCCEKCHYVNGYNAINLKDGSCVNRSYYDGDNFCVDIILPNEKTATIFYNSEDGKPEFYVEYEEVESIYKYDTTSNQFTLVINN